MTMHFWDAYWGLRLAECPCDVHFLEWLAETGVEDSAIYHFGSGGHHVVGVECAKAAKGNVVMSVTAAPQEYDDYVKLLIENPEVSKSYICYFGDIYTVNSRLLPPLDIVTLFHMREFRSEKNDSYGARTDVGVALELAKVTRPGGYVLFYTGSFAWDAAKPDVAELERLGVIEPAGAYKTLLVYKRTAKPVA
jgi:hypothetical protein